MNLKEIRLSKGISVPKLVELSGVPRRTIQDIEKMEIVEYQLLLNSLTLSM